VLRYNFKRGANGLSQGIPLANYTQNGFGGSDTKVVTSVKLFQAPASHAVGRVGLKYRKHDGSIVSVPNPTMPGLGQQEIPYICMTEMAGNPWRNSRDCSGRAFDGLDQWSGSTSWHFQQYTYVLWDRTVDVHQVKFSQCCGGDAGDGHTGRNLLVQKLLPGADPENDDSWETFQQYTGNIRRVQSVSVEPGEVITTGIRIRGGDAAPGSGRDTPDAWYRFNYLTCTAFEYIDLAVQPHFAKPHTPAIEVSFDPIETDMLEVSLFKYEPPTCESLLSDVDHCGRANAVPVTRVMCSTQHNDGSYRCGNAIDCDQSTSWITLNQREGASIELRFETDSLVTGFSWTHRGNSERFRQIRLEFTDGSSQTVELLNDNEARSYALDPVVTEGVTIVATSIWAGNHIGAKEIFFYADPSGLDVVADSACTPRDPATIPPHKNCAEILAAGDSTGSGVYTVYQERRVKSVYCDMVTSGGGWTLWQDFGSSDRWGLGPGPRTRAQYEALGWTISRGTGTDRQCNQFGRDEANAATSNFPVEDYGSPGEDYLEFFADNGECAISKDLPSEGVDEIMMKGGTSTQDNNNVRVRIGNPGTTPTNRRPLVAPQNSLRGVDGIEYLMNDLSRPIYPGHLEHILPAAPGQRFWMNEENSVATIYWIFYRHTVPTAENAAESPWHREGEAPVCTDLSPWMPGDDVSSTSIEWGYWTPNEGRAGSSSPNWGDSMGCGGAGQCSTLHAAVPDEFRPVLERSILLNGRYGNNDCPDMIAETGEARECPSRETMSIGARDNDMERWLANGGNTATGGYGPPLADLGWDFANGRFTVDGVTVYYQLCAAQPGNFAGFCGRPGRMQGSLPMSWRAAGAAEMSKLTQLAMLSGQAPSVDCFRHEGDDDVNEPGGTGSSCECTGRPEFCTQNYDGTDRSGDACGRTGCAGLASILNHCQSWTDPGSNLLNCVANSDEYQRGDATVRRLRTTTNVDAGTAEWFEEEVPRGVMGNANSVFGILVTTSIDTICLDEAPPPAPVDVTDPVDALPPPQCVGLTELEIFGCADCLGEPPTADETGDCPMDINGDDSTGIADLLLVLSAFGMNNCDLSQYDYDSDCQIGVVDLLAVLANFGCSGCFDLLDPTCGGEERGTCSGGRCVCTDDYAGESCEISATRSCMTILQKNPNAQSGSYEIQDDTFNGGSPLSVYCDMDTDGGGYTIYQCQGCQSANKAWQPNGCTDLGLQWLVPRSYEHVCAIKDESFTFGNIVGGVVGKHNGDRGNNWTPFAFNSDTGMPLTNNWVAVDGGTWWLRDSSFSEPNGDYSQGAFLGPGLVCNRNHHFNDLTGGYGSGSNYLCSTNDKGGPGVFNLQDPDTGMSQDCVDAGCACAPDCRRP
jgi:hypothetical protein